MNVSERIKTEEVLSIEKESIIHLMLVNNLINERIGKALKPFDVSLEQFNVLRILRGQKGKPANLSTLNERMVTKKSNTTRLVDKLVLKGYADRITCQSNRRKIEISLTKKGSEVLKEIDEVMSEIEKSILQRFTKEELEYLNLLLHKF